MTRKEFSGLWAVGAAAIALTLAAGCVEPTERTRARANLPSYGSTASAPVFPPARSTVEYGFPNIDIPRPTSSTLPKLTALRPFEQESALLPGGFVADKIVVEKSKRRLHLLNGGRTVKSYRVSLGFAPEGHKQRRGDGRTPEGVYYISNRNAESGFHRSLRISYPDAVDRLRARASGIDPGGDIMIHGLPNADDGSVARMQSHIDWTLGCVAVNDMEMDEIWGSVPIGTPIEILP